MVGRSVKTITDFIVDKIFGTLNIGIILHISSMTKFLDAFIYCSTMFVDKNVKHGNQWVEKNCYQFVCVDC